MFWNWFSCDKDKKAADNRKEAFEVTSSETMKVRTDFHKSKNKLNTLLTELKNEPRSTH